MRGLYIHIPFCIKKCGYCDFYSVKFSRPLADLYTNEIIRRLDLISEKYDTVYFGGGTPSVIGENRICEILAHIKHTSGAEITVECNPITATAEFMKTILLGGVNRVSIGMQSAVNEELRLLTRTHNFSDVCLAVENAKNAGIDNISLDIMLGIPNQTKDTVKYTVNACAKLGVQHISAYMLKIEQNTPFANLPQEMFCDDDTTAGLYISACKQLETHGFMQYEISNFAKDNMLCRHNMKYWNCDEYDALGPAAHGFSDGKRYYYPRDIDYFLQGKPPVFEADFGGFSEYAMLRLRLCGGIVFDDMKSRGIEMPNGFLEKCRPFAEHGFLKIDNDRIYLTRKGFLVQNAVLCEIL